MALLLPALTVLALATAAAPTYDVVVYGSTPAGIAASVSAGTLGLKVALFEPLKMARAFRSAFLLPFRSLFGQFIGDLPFS